MADDAGRDISQAKCRARSAGADADRDPPWVADHVAVDRVAGALADRGDVVGGRQNDGPVAQADGARRGGRDVLTTPDVEGEVGGIAARGDGGRAGQARHELEAEDVAGEGEALLDVADVEGQVPHPQALARVTRRPPGPDE